MSEVDQQKQLLSLYTILYSFLHTTPPYNTNTIKDIRDFITLYNTNYRITIDTQENITSTIPHIQDTIINICELKLYELQKNNPKIAAMEFTEWQKYNRDFYMNVHNIKTINNQQYFDWIYTTYQKQYTYSELNKSINKEILSKIGNNTPVNINDIYKILINYTYKAEETEIANHMEINKHLQDIHELLLKLTTNQTVVSAPVSETVPVAT